MAPLTPYVRWPPLCIPHACLHHKFGFLIYCFAGGREDTQAKLAKVDAELAELDKVHELTEKRSSRRSDALLFCGLVILFTQFVGFIWLTW